MANPDDPAVPPAVQPSIAARLRQRFGTDVDPRVELAADSDRREPAGAATKAIADARAPVSPGVFGRLVGRGPIASRYQLRGEIARGGMGAILEVFDEDLRRRLAMKVILDRETDTPGTDTSRVDPAVLGRFLEEAQVTGQLDHPGIVPVHELGLDARGQVYFTMRLVHGRDLEAILALVASGSEGWSTTRALGVLLKVCEAMAYAHSKGVVHRDLKPANVMVGRFGEVYVMDWGVARVRGHDDRHDLRLKHGGSAAPIEKHERVETDRRDDSTAGSDSALRTMDGDIVGTPSYMAPEQARGELEALDERADVYAVGAMLYRLLAGTAPYTSAGDKLGVVEVWERVLAGPPRTVEQLAPAAPAELVAICSKAMARDPSQRYPDMFALSEDVRAFLEGRVVSAFETGAIAEARKWVRRNRPLAASLAAAVLALIAGLVASVAFAHEARDSALLAEKRRGESDANATDARKQARIAKAASAFLNEDLLAAIAPENMGIDVTVREVLDQASAQLPLRFGSEPAIESELRMTIGTSYRKLGVYDRAREQFVHAVELRKETDGPHAEGTLLAMVSLAGSLSALDRQREAIDLYRDALALMREHLGPENPQTLTAASDLALALTHVAQYDEARDLYVAALATAKRVLGSDHEDTLMVRSNLAMLDRDQGRFADAVLGMRGVVERRRATQGETHPDTLDAVANLALVLADAGQFDESESLARATLEEQRTVLGPDHPRVLTAQMNLGYFLTKLGRTSEARAVFTEGLKAIRTRLGEDHALTLTTRYNVASATTDPALREEVLEEQRSVLEARQRVLGPEHPETLESMDAVACGLRDLNRLAEAEAMDREALDLKIKVLGEDHPATIVTRENLGGVLFGKGEAAKSVPIVRAVLESRRRVLGDAHPDVARTECNLAMVLAATGDTMAALESIEQALAHSRAALGNEHPQVISCLRTLGDLRVEAKQRDAALAAYREAIEVHRKLGPDDDLAGYLLHQMAYLHYEQGEYASALAESVAAVAVRESVLGPDAANTCMSLRLEVMTLIDLERYADAEPLALELLARANRIRPPNPGGVKIAREELVDLYTEWGKPDEAEKWR